MTTSERLTLARLLSGHGFTLPMIRSTIEVTESGVRGMTDAEWREVVEYLRDPTNGGDRYCGTCGRLKEDCQHGIAQARPGEEG